MKPVFPTYIIKNHAKKAMQGRFLKAFAISFIPLAVIFAAAALMFFFMPGVKSSFELALSGNFESLEERMLYLDLVMNNYTWAVELIAVLFSFLSLGAARLCVDMVRGKDVKVRNIFCFYNKWYIAALYPALSFAVTTAAVKGLNMLVASGANAYAIKALSWVIQIAVYFVTFKLMFIDYTLAENNCSDFIGAIKASWKMVGWNTVVNSVVLTFSFFGWFILGAFTAGIVLIYAIPYLTLSMAALYDANVKYNAECGVQNAEL